ncbi:hypothetical protein SS50377_24686 [Spironucleus salmonicida]|uniref:Uncharacterized protein n=1 Tax=Spironucleus salmonicida TaxID=348837 RepID=V6LUK8_9EUKA|nr:hypothetical protein SS50377_24686 [Spironucleus salmonicida]|eukprot:EST44494.1 Hypothetical protein SS50377_15492 [Spironucleus salmonicida]
MSLKAFTPATPIRLFDLLQIKALQKKSNMPAIGIATSLFAMKTSLTDVKCQIAFEILKKATEELKIEAKDIECLLTGDDAFAFWPLVMDKSKMSIKDAAEIEGLTNIKQFNSSAHAIAVAVTQALGGEFVPTMYKFREFRVPAEEVGAFIMVGDDLSTVQKKINKAVCEEGADNDVLQQFETVEKLEDSITVNDEVMNYADLRAKFLNKEISAKSLKDSLIQFYGRYLVQDDDIKQLSVKLASKK